MRKKDLLAALVAGGFMLVPMMVQAETTAPSDSAPAITEPSSGSEETPENPDGSANEDPDANPEGNSGQNNAGTNLEDGSSQASGEDLKTDSDSTDADPEENAGEPAVLSDDGITENPVESEKKVVAGSDVFSADKDYVSEDHTISWSAKDQTLTLNNANITADADFLGGEGAAPLVGFESFDESDVVTIQLKGSNTISYENETDQLVSFISNNRITLNLVGEEDAALTLTNTNVSPYNYYIQAEYLNIENLNLTINGSGWALSAGKDMTVNNSIITLTGNQQTLAVSTSNLTLTNSALSINEEQTQDGKTILNIGTDLIAKDSSIYASGSNQRLIHSSIGNVVFENSDVELISKSTGVVVYAANSIQSIDSDLTLDINLEEENIRETGDTSIGALMSNGSISFTGARSYINISSPNCPALYVVKAAEIHSPSDEYTPTSVQLDVQNLFLNTSLDTDFSPVIVNYQVLHWLYNDETLFFDDLNFADYAPQIEIGSHMHLLNYTDGQSVQSVGSGVTRHERINASGTTVLEWIEQTAFLSTENEDEPQDPASDYVNNVYSYRDTVSYADIYKLSYDMDYYQDLYTNESLQKVKDLLAQMDPSAPIDEQDQADALMAKIKEAYNALEFKNPNATIVDYNSAVEALEKAIEEKSDTLVLDQSKDTLDQMAIDLSVLLLAADNDMSLEIKAKDMNITLDAKTIQTIRETYDEIYEANPSSEVKGYIVLSIHDVDLDSLSDAQKATLKKSAAYKVIEASILVNDQEVESFNGGTVTLSIPVSAFDGDENTTYKLVYVADDGTLQELSSKCADGYVSASLVHFSVYAVVEDTITISIDPADDNTAAEIENTASDQTNATVSGVTPTTASTSASTSGVSTAASFGAGQYLAGLILGAAGIFESKKRRKEN
jgi:hypothetical protein